MKRTIRPKRRPGASFCLPISASHSRRTRLPGAITRDERERVNVLIVKPDCVERTLGFFGGEWRQVARYKADSAGRVPLLELLKVGAKPYDIIIYRRPDSDVNTAHTQGKSSTGTPEVGGDASTWTPRPSPG